MSLSFYFATTHSKYICLCFREVRTVSGDDLMLIVKADGTADRNANGDVLFVTSGKKNVQLTCSDIQLLTADTGILSYYGNILFIMSIDRGTVGSGGQLTSSFFDWGSMNVV